MAEKKRGQRKCRVCSIYRAPRYYQVNGGFVRNCLSCRLMPKVDARKSIPADWLVPLQIEEDSLRFAIQCIGPSTCYKCKHMQTCRANVVLAEYKLPCQVST